MAFFFFLPSSVTWKAEPEWSPCHQPTFQHSATNYSTNISALSNTVSTPSRQSHLHLWDALFPTRGCLTQRRQAKRIYCAKVDHCSISAQRKLNSMHWETMIAWACVHVHIHQHINLQWRTQLWMKINSWAASAAIFRLLCLPETIRAVQKAQCWYVCVGIELENIT